MQPQVYFFGGLNTIGGNNILVGYGDTAIVFDLGRMPTGYYGWGSGDICPASHKIRSYLALRCAPPLLHLYDTAYVGDITHDDLQRVWHMDLPRYDKLYAFVSHIHQDHMELLPYIAPDITVFMHNEALATYRGVVKSGEYIDTNANLYDLSDMETVTLSEDFTIQVVELDHDTPGASGILINVGGRKLFFTGDYRMHGRHSGRVADKAKYLREQCLDMLITEGTTLRTDNVMRREAEVNELDLPQLYRDMLSQCEGLAYVNILCRNIERVADFINVTRECGRKLVMDARTALLWHDVCRDVRTLDGNPAVTDCETVVLFEDEIQDDLPYQSVRYSDIVNNKRGYCVYLTQQRTGVIAELERLGQQNLTSHYFHADGNPLNDNDATLLYWLKSHGIRYHYHGTGGHITPVMLTEFIEAVSPKVVVPLHSVNPSICDAGHVPKLLPHYGMCVDLGALS